VFAEIGALWVDHVAVTTDRFEETAQHYLSLPNARILRGPGWNAAQEVHFLFVSFGGDLCIEILGLPSEGSSPISGHVASGAGAYHLCHAVRDLDVAISAAEVLGAKLLVPAKADDAYDGRRVAFLMHPAHGMFELVEAYGTLIPPAQTSGKQFASLSTPSSTSKSASTSSADSADLSQALQAAFAAIFRKQLPASPADWTVDSVEGWNSLQHMRLMMEIERRLDLTIPSRALGALKSYDAIFTFLLEQTAS